MPELKEITERNKGFGSYSIEEFEKIGAALLVVRNFLVTLEVQTHRRYIKKNNPGDNLHNAVAQIDKARSTLENYFYKTRSTSPGFEERFGRSGDRNKEENDPINIFYGNRIFEQKEPIGLKFLEEYEKHFKEQERLFYENKRGSD